MLLLSYVLVLSLAIYGHVFDSLNVFLFGIWFSRFDLISVLEIEQMRWRLCENLRVCINLGGSLHFEYSVSAHSRRNIEIE